MSGLCLVWLEWPEKCFRADAKALRVLKGFVSDGTRVVRVRGEEEFLRRLPRATKAIVWHFRREWFALAPKLEMLATPSAGRELVAWRDAPEGVRVHFGSFHGALMSETVAAFVLAYARGFLFRQPDNWPRVWLSDKCSLVAGTKAAIVGYGHVGRAIGEKLAALGVEVEGFNRSNISTLPRKAKIFDWLVMALPSDTGTDGFLDRRLIAKLSPKCVVANVGRGNAVNEDDLFEALRKRRIAAAFLDVRKREPQPAKPPVKYPENLYLLPHASAFGADYLIRCFEELHAHGCV